MEYAEYYLAYGFPAGLFSLFLFLLVQLLWTPRNHGLPFWVLLVGVLVGALISTFTTMFSLGNQMPWSIRPYGPLILGALLLSRLPLLWKDATGNFWTSLVATQLLGFGLMDLMVALGWVL